MRTTILFTALLLFVSTAQATVWRVNNNPHYVMGENGAPLCDHCFDDLQDAIYSPNVFPTDTLLLEASPTSYGAVDLNKQLVIIGAGYFLTDNPGEQATNLRSIVQIITFQPESANSVITGVSFDVFSNQHLTFLEGANNITITRCYLLSGILLGSTPISGLTIRKNYIEGSIVNYSNSVGVVLDIDISNNHIGGEIGLYNQVTGSVTNNVIDGNVYIQTGVSQFYNNIVTNAGLVMTEYDNSSANIYNNIFVAEQPDWLNGGNNHFGVPINSIFPAVGDPEDLVTTLPACNANQCTQGFDGDGTDDALIGIFGGLDPYRRAGIPAIPTIYQLQSNVNAYPGGDINVVISTKTNQ